MKKPKKKKPALTLQWKVQQRICSRCSELFLPTQKRQDHCIHCLEIVVNTHLAERR